MPRLEWNFIFRIPHTTHNNLFSFGHLVWASPHSIAKRHIYRIHPRTFTTYNLSRKSLENKVQHDDWRVLLDRNHFLPKGWKVLSGSTGRFVGRNVLLVWTFRLWERFVKKYVRSQTLLMEWPHTTQMYYLSHIHKTLCRRKEKCPRCAHTVAEWECTYPLGWVISEMPKKRTLRTGEIMSHKFKMPKNRTYCRRTWQSTDLLGRVA